MGSLRRGERGWGAWVGGRGLRGGGCWRGWLGRGIRASSVDLRNAMRCSNSLVFGQTLLAVILIARAPPKVVGTPQENAKASRKACAISGSSTNAARSFAASLALLCALSKYSSLNATGLGYSTLRKARVQ